LFGVEGNSFNESFIACFRAIIENRKKKPENSTSKICVKYGTAKALFNGQVSQSKLGVRQE
jgi:hypothetical protein